MKVKFVIILFLITFQNIKSISWQDSLKWVIILSAPAITAQVIEQNYDALKDNNNEFRDAFALIPSTLFLAACDRAIDKSNSFEKYYIDLAKNFFSLILVKAFHDFEYQNLDRHQKRIISPVNKLFGVMDATTYGQIAKYASLFKFVKYIFKNVVKVHIEPMHI
jgi:Na+(H+)/acetate symporter ActP